jgi:hypothetical protein
VSPLQIPARWSSSRNQVLSITRIAWNTQKCSLGNFGSFLVFTCVVDMIITVTYNLLIYLFIFSDTAAKRGLWPRSRGFVITHNDAPQSVRLLWTSDQIVAETSTWQHTQQTNIHFPGGIRTHDRSRRAAVDIRLRPRGHWDRPLWHKGWKIKNKLVWVMSVLNTLEFGIIRINTHLISDSQIEHT